MSWAVGDNSDGRDIGYGVPALCDQPGCGAEIDRGLARVCGDMHDGGDHGCGRYFCSEHLHLVERGDALIQLCDRCSAGEPPHDPTPDTGEWLEHKLTDPSWEQWRRENPEAAETARRLLGETS